MGACTEKEKAKGKCLGNEKGSKEGRKFAGVAVDRVARRLYTIRWLYGRGLAEADASQAWVRPLPMQSDQVGGRMCPSSQSLALLPARR